MVIGLYKTQCILHATCRMRLFTVTVKGSAYGAFSRGFVQYLLTNQKARDLLEWMRTTYSPDELYWATLNYRYVNPHLHVPGAAHGMYSRPIRLCVGLV